MSELRDVQVLALDCQAAGATPAHGDLLEVGWALCSARQGTGAVQSCWIVPRTTRRVPRAVRELTGWSEACIAEAVEEHEAWSALLEQCRGALPDADSPVPTVIHFARFELPFLRDVHARAAGERAFPLDVLCLHAVAERLFPDLPRRNIRALAGFLGHSPALVRRSAGHVEATAFIWNAIVPVLEQQGVRTWSELHTWLAATARGKRSPRRVFPFSAERRRALPDAPGVYRFVRRNGDVLYVGKAASLKKRIASHFNAGARATERGLELLTQVNDVVFTRTPSMLEAALLECDEIKRIDPPYNVQLRGAERSAWFAARDFSSARPAPDALHAIGPLPSERALLGFSALIALLEGAPPSSGLCTRALAVPAAFLPSPDLFLEGWQGFSAELLSTTQQDEGDTGDHSAARRVQRAARALWLERGRAELERPAEEAAPDQWDLARVRRRLERSLVQGGLLIRRARWLSVLADADVAFRERQMVGARLLVFSGAALVEAADMTAVADLTSRPARRPQARWARQRAFDAAAYDRLRVLLTELRRVQDERGEVVLRIGTHTCSGEQLSRWLREV